MKSLDTILADPRLTVRRAGTPNSEGSCVVYWMQRAQRGIDNPALDLAINLANELQKPLAVFFGLHPKYPNSNIRHYTFLLAGLPETARQIEERGAAFVFRPYPQHDLIKFCEEVNACLVVGDENPMREPESWRQAATQKLRVPFYTVDADVDVPVKFFEKEEYAARTIRPKITRLLLQFLVPFENPNAHFKWSEKSQSASTSELKTFDLKSLPINQSSQPVNTFQGGNIAAMKRLHEFTKTGLQRYDTDRNLPHVDGTSALSAYLHFGQLSPVTIALAVQETDAPKIAKDAYLEELIVRREIAINYVARNPNYDNLEGCHEWAKKSLRESISDVRTNIYSQPELEEARTHDDLWNAAQMEMVKSGRMHGFLRMYWAKKILEWSPTPAEAFSIAVSLNDRYQLDGRDPNGYTGIAWAIGAKHDRPWAPKREIFGMVRYMNYNGCKRKFDIQAYIKKIYSL